MVALLPRLRRFAYALTRSVDEGDDVVQAACERALRSLDQFREGTRLDSWMFRIIQNIWIDRMRARQARGTVVGAEMLERAVGADGVRTTEAILTLQAVRSIVAELPAEQQAVLALISVDGMSYKQAAETLELPIGTVTSRLARARRRIMERLYGADAPGGGPVVDET
jgi:RNA polymerase sigma-70 factor (ECF subfamily)